MGVGIFGIPYVLVKAGALAGILYFIILGAIVLLVNLFYGEIILRTKEEHRLVGYAEIYLGKWGKRLTTFSNIAGFYGAILAYTLIGGQFLFLLLGPIFGGTSVVYSLIFFGAIALAIFVGLALIKEAELIMNIFLVLTFIIICIASILKLNLASYTAFNWSDVFLPYGVILFALGSLSAVPEVREVLRNNPQKFKQAIKWGTIIPIIITIIFSFLIVGAVGGNITPDAIASLKSILGLKLYALGIFFGLLAVITSFLVIGLNLKRLYVFDYRLKNYQAWILSMLVPLIIYIFGTKDFIKVIGITGGILGGLDGLLVSLIYLRAKKLGQRQPEYNLRLSRFWPGLVIAIFGLGIIYEIYFSILK